MTNVPLPESPLWVTFDLPDGRRVCGPMPAGVNSPAQLVSQVAELYGQQPVRWTLSAMPKEILPEADTPHIIEAGRE